VGALVVVEAAVVPAAEREDAPRVAALRARRRVVAAAGAVKTFTTRLRPMTTCRSKTAETPPRNLGKETQPSSLGKRTQPRDLGKKIPPSCLGKEIRSSQHGEALDNFRAR
jgi:hypothetical protein